jgi:uncharacterized protein
LPLLSMDLYKVMPSRNGLGVFARKNFIAEEVIMQITGKLITCYLDDDIDEKTRNNTFRFDEEKYLSPDGGAQYVNHSCGPNSKIVKKNRKLFLVAIQAILNGEEIVFDYSTTLASNDIWSMKCNCGSDMCRGVVKRFSLLPKNLRERYIQDRIVPQFILKL